MLNNVIIYNKCNPLFCCFFCFHKKPNKTKKMAGFDRNRACGIAKGP